MFQSAIGRIPVGSRILSERACEEPRRSALRRSAGVVRISELEMFQGDVKHWLGTSVDDLPLMLLVEWCSPGQSQELMDSKFAKALMLANGRHRSRCPFAGTRRGVMEDKACSADGQMSRLCRFGASQVQIGIYGVPGTTRVPEYRRLLPGCTS